MLTAELDFPTQNAAAEDFFHDELPNYSHCSSEPQLNMKHELSENKKHVIKFKKHNLFPGSDDNEHNKKSYSSIVDDMRSETTYED